MVVGEPIITDRHGAVGVLFCGRQLGDQGSDGAAPGRVAWVRQVHGCTVVEASGEGEKGEADGLFTRHVGVALAIQTADCLPVLMAGRDFVAAVHAGWRGLAQGIVEKTARSLGAIDRVWIGPAIGPCCYEVGPEVAEAFPDPGAVTPGRGDRFQLDLQRVARQRLPAGVEVVDFGICTRCDERWWSYRRSRADAERAGRNLSLIWLGAVT